MTFRTRRNNHRKYSKNTQDHIAFVLVILLAASIYTHQLYRLINQQSIILIIRIAVALITIATLVIFLRRHRLNIEYKNHDTQIDNMSGTEFEQYIANLLRKQGYSHIKLTEHYDLGLDIIAQKEGQTWGIQVKRYNRPVKMAAVRQVVSALKHYDCERAMVITNSFFSAPAQELAASNNCILIDRQQLMRWSK